MAIDYRVLITAEEKQAHQSAVQALFQRAFNRPLPEVDWQHFVLDSPYEPGRCVVAVDGDRVVGTANLIPQRLSMAGSTIEYFLFTTSMVDPDYRKQGVYLGTTRLAIQTAKEAGRSFILAFPNEMALRPLTVLFPFKRFGDIPLVSGRLEQFGPLRAIDVRRSICLDGQFMRWRFDHRAYFRMSSGETTLVCKEYAGGVDIAEVLADLPASLGARLPEKQIELPRVNVLATRCAAGDAQVLTTLHATCCVLRQDIDPADIDISLLMWDVV